MALKFSFTEWEVMVIRAAVASYRTKPLPPKHESAIVEIEAKLRAHDNPMQTLAEINRKKRR